MILFIRLYEEELKVYKIIIATYSSTLLHLISHKKYIV